MAKRRGQSADYLKALRKKHKLGEFSRNRRRKSFRRRTLRVSSVRVGSDVLGL